MTDNADAKRTLVLGGTGKTGRRLVERLRARALPVRVGSRSGEPPFDWEDEATWARAFAGVGSFYPTGRKPKDFADFAREVAAAGIWHRGPARRAA